MNWKNKKVFISGGAGVIGRELVKKLVDLGAIVMVGDLQEIPNDFPSNIIYRRGDLNYITQQEVNSFNPEVFIHLAATFERSVETYEHWEENFWHNVRLSNHLMTLMRNVPNLKRVVFASSYLIYNKELYQFDKPSDKPIKLKETDAIQPRNLTGMAKLSHEIELDFLNKFKGEKFSSISARIFRGYGKNSRDVIGRWIRDLIKGKTIYIYNQEGWFDYIYAEDTAEGLLRLANINDTGIVNLGIGDSRKVSDVVNILSAYFPNINKEYVVNNEKYEASEADIAKLIKLTNWKPQRRLEDTIPEIINYEQKKREKFEELRNVLITSISKKVPLIKAVKRGVKKINSSIKVYGGDVDSNCIGKYFVDEFWQMPKLEELSEYDLLNFCKKNNIGLIIPSRDGELEYFSEIKDKLRKVGTHVMVSDLEIVKKCLDKLKFSKIENIHAIPAVVNIEELDAKSYVVKERYGAGSRSIGIDLSKNDAITHSQSLKSPIFQPFIKGSELSVDAYVELNGNIKGIVIRKRELVVNGESQITSTFYDDELEIKFKEIIKNLYLYGHIIMQVIIDENKDIHLIECNPRFGGASTLSLKVGLDSFYWAYLESKGISIGDYPFIRSVTNIKQIRHAEDIFL